jgi:predicted nucleic acid-binding protein
MRRVLLDTNIILDIALKREPHFTLSKKIFELIDHKRIIGFITATTVTDIYYIFRKEKGKKLALEFIWNLIEVIDVIGVDRDTIVQALKNGLNDFEDAVQVSAAKTNDIEIIITRNNPDFVKSGLTVMTPKEAVNKL